MSVPQTPEEGEPVEVINVDREIEALRAGLAKPDDPALSVLIELRDDVDSRAAALLGRRGCEEWALDVEAFPDPLVSPVPIQPARRRWDRRRLAVLPAAGALVLASTGAAAALSGSPHAPLYPLHRLIFGPAPSSDGQITHDLTAAQRWLDRAAAVPLRIRGNQLSQARILLSAARDLLPRASSADARARLTQGIDAALARAKQLATPPAPQTQPSPSPAATDPDGVSPGPAEPSDAEPSDSESAPAAAGGSTPQRETDASEGSATAVVAIETEAPAPAAKSSPLAQSESEPHPGSSFTRKRSTAENPDG